MSHSSAVDDYHSRLRAREARVKEQLVMKLKDYRLLSDEQTVQFKCDAVALYDKERWGLPDGQPRNSRHQQRDVDEKFNAITLHYFIHSVVDCIEKNVPNDRCIQVYEDVMSVLPRDEQAPPSTRPNPRETPATPFSVSRAAPGSVKSNAQLIDTLASAANLKPSTAAMIRGQIVWCDSTPGGRNGSSGIFDTRTKLVSYGRLGRSHMLSDVPNHYVRDRLMDYINTQLEEDQQENARKAVFSDLTPAEIEQYSALIIKKAEEDRPKTDDELVALVAGNRPIATARERGHVLDQAVVLERVDTDVDLTPKPGFDLRDYRRPGPITRSVVKPGLYEPTPAERSINPGIDIDRDCDQIRAMIAIFITKTDWTADQFRLALSGVERKDLTSFLEKTGPTKGNKNVFELAWEFFKRREILGLPLTGARTAEDGGVLQERDANTNTRKRRSEDGNNGKATTKRTRGA
ncbi:hypothetical protein F5Y13DRAFT_162735 [Hypoxylon sp. FL1857]|nr:hypothetical protein F5Y13DRAFT_162735 [Hypoxylon sp. FL1857]